MEANQARQKHNRLLSWLINLAGVVFFGLILYLGGIEAWQQILRADWQFIGAALATTLIWNLVATFRWALIANQVVAVPEPCPFPYYHTYHMIGMLIGQVVPITVGMLGGRPTALSMSRGGSLKRSALSVFLDKLFDLLLALLLVLPVAFFLVDWIDLPTSVAWMGAMVVLGMVLLGWRYRQTVQWVGRVGSRLAKPMVRLPLVGRRLMSRLPQHLDRLATETFVSNRLSVQVFLLTLVMYALLSVRHIFIAQALRLDIPGYLLAMGVCITQLALIFSVTPGSLGFLEGGWATVFALAALSPEQFLVFVIGRRAFVLVFTLFGTLLAFLWIRESPARLFRAVLEASRQPPQPDVQKESPSVASR